MNPLPLRVMVLDTWDEISLAVPPTALVSDLKAQALVAAKVRKAPAEYVVKFRGAELTEGNQTLGDAGVVANAGLIVLPRTRTPVR